MTIYYLTLGYDCSPAAALRILNLREFALPFDWVISNVSILENCFEDNFSKFHKNLKLNGSKKRLIDEYGFQFPHDYPLNNSNVNIDNIGEGVFGEENDKIISDNWINYHHDVLAKYNRRIERFNNIINDRHPIIVLCRYNTNDVLKLQLLFLKYYKKENVYFINSTNEIFETDKIKNINTEKNNVWNDINIWKPCIDNIILDIQSQK
jgi:hypothetical protein